MTTISFVDWNHWLEQEGSLRFGIGDERLTFEVFGLGSDRFALHMNHGNSTIDVRGGVLGSISGGDGNHTINAGLVSSVRLGDGNSQVRFAVGEGESDPNIVLGDGNSIIHGTSIDANDNNSTNIQLGRGNNKVLLDGDDWDGVSIKGGSGNHFLQVGEISTVQLGNGNSVVRFADGIDTDVTKITLGSGNNVIGGVASGSNTATKIKFGDGNNVVVLQGDGTHDFVGTTIVGGSGDNTVFADEAKLVKLGSGNNLISFNVGADNAPVIKTGSGNNVIVGTAKTGTVTTSIKAGSGNDTIILLGNVDWNSGRTKINTDGGKDHLYLTSSTDASEFVRLSGVERITYIDESSTLDNIIVLDGKSGIATGQVLDFSRDLNPKFDQVFEHGIDVAPIDDAYIETLRTGRLMESAEDFFLRINAFELSFANGEFTLPQSAPIYNEVGELIGTASDDVIVDLRGKGEIFAMDGDDRIEGGNGKDRIYAGKGNDIVEGGAGQDLLDGGEGYDVLIGGAGIDVFVFRKDEGTTVIEDFELSYDVLDVEGFENLTYEDLTEAGRQVGDDVIYELGSDTLILRNVELATMQEIDLCMK